MGLTNDLATALIAKAAALPAIRSAHALAPDTIPSSPAAVVGPHTATYELGNREVRVYTFPLRVYVARLADDARTQNAVNDIVDAMVDAYGQGIALGNPDSSSAVGVITGWTTDSWIEIGGTEYQVVEFTYQVTTRRARNDLTA